jgi:hypothetical protein
LHNAKVTHDYGNNLITIEGNGMVRIIAVTKHLDGNIKLHEVLFYFDFMNDVIDDMEGVLLQIELNIFTIGTITLLKLEMGASVLTTKVFGVDFGIEDLIFDFPHIIGEIEVDTIPTCIKVQHMKIACWNLPKDNASTRPNLGHHEELKMVKFYVDLGDVIIGEVEALLQEYKDMFTWAYKELIKIPPHIIQHQIELDITIPPIHQMNLNYAIVVK